MNSFSTAIASRPIGRAVLSAFAPIAAPLRAVRVLPVDDPAVVRFIAGHRCQSLFTSPPWIRALTEAYGFRIEACVRMIDGRVAGAMPFCHLVDLRGERLVVMPFSDYADPLVDDADDFAAIIDQLASFGPGLRLRALQNPLPAADPRFETLAEAFWHGLDLDRPLDAVWDGLEGSARQNIRKAERNGLVVRIGRTLQDVELFHAMHVRLRKSKYRLLAQPAGFFRALHEAFAPTDGIAVAIAELDGLPVAGILLLEWMDTLYYKFNASLDTRLRPNDLLAWHAIRYAKERGLKRFDFGLSDADQPGLVRYKQKFATDERMIRECILQSRLAPAPDQRAAGQALGRLTELLTRSDVPDTVTAEAGDALYRYFA